MQLKEPTVSGCLVFMFELKPFIEIALCLLAWARQELPFLTSPQVETVFVIFQYLRYYRSGSARMWGLSSSRCLPFVLGRLTERESAAAA